MVTQTNNFFPIPAPNSGNSASAVSQDRETDKENSFTQAFNQAQAQKNLHKHAILKGMAGLSPQDNATTTPDEPMNTESVPAETPGEETTPATLDANAITLVGLSMTPLVIPNAVPMISPESTQTALDGNEVAPTQAQIAATDANFLNLASLNPTTPTIENAAQNIASVPVANNASASTPTTPNAAENALALTQTPQTVPSVDLTAGQISQPSGAEDIAALVTAIQAAKTTTTDQSVSETGQNPAPSTPAITNPEPTTTQGTATKEQTAANTSVSPANAVTAANAGQVTATKSETIHVSTPNRTPEMEPRVVSDRVAVAVEPVNAAQNGQKPVTALPMDTERAIALPNLVIAPSMSKTSADTDASTDSDSHESEILAAIAQPVERTTNAANAQTFGDTLQRLEISGRPVTASAETAKPNPTDRYEVAQQVTKQLEILTTTSGRSEIIVQLKPEHLGKIKVTLSKSENGLSAKIVSDSVQTQTALNGAKESLRAAFEQRGMTLESLEVTLNPQASANGQQTFAGMQQGNPQTQSQSLRTVSGRFLPDEEMEISASITAIPARNSLNRLDFRA